MPQFQMPDNDTNELIQEFDKFTRSYIEALYWTECNEDRGIPEDAEMSLDLIAKIKEDCDDFQVSADTVLQRAYTEKGYTEEQAGIDFWLTRNGHGAGFWDRGLKKTGEILTGMAKAYGQTDIYEDGGKLYAG